MAISTKLSWFLLIALLALIHPSHCYFNPNEEDLSAEEQLYQCLQRCGGQGHNQQYQTKCQQRCVDQYKQIKQQEEGRGRGGGNDDRRDPDQQLSQCLSSCYEREHEIYQLEGCQMRCHRQYQEQKRRGQGGGGMNQQQGERGQQQQEGENPYYFPASRFKSRHKSQEGEIRVLGNFNKRSDLLRGVENNRLRLHVANPQTVILPHHNDAASVFVVLSGQGSINYQWPPNQRRNFNLKEWDVIRIPAGALFYVVNHHNNEKLYLLELLRPINIPGKFKSFFGTGGQNPQSYLRSFSDQVLEAAFKSPRKDVEQLFSQEQGAIVKASGEQIRALRQESESQEGREEIWGPINLYQERRPISNEYGQHFEASPEDHDQLRDLDVSVGLMNISQGGMTAPYYNSRATKLVFVTGGQGRVEMICPHLESSQGQGQGRGGSSQQGGKGYQRVTADIKVGDVLVVPNAHPIAIYATQRELQMVSFGIKGSYNQKYFLAGQENVWNEIPAAAREVSFSRPAQELDEILKRQDKSYFLPGPGQQQQQQEQQRGRGGGERLVESILEFAGF